YPEAGLRIRAVSPGQSLVHHADDLKFRRPLRLLLCAPRHEAYSSTFDQDRSAQNVIPAAESLLPESMRYNEDALAIGLVLLDLETASERQPGPDALEECTRDHLAGDPLSLRPDLKRHRGGTGRGFERRRLLGDAVDERERQPPGVAPVVPPESDDRVARLEASVRAKNQIDVKRYEGGNGGDCRHALRLYSRTPGAS